MYFLKVARFKIYRDYNEQQNTILLLKNSPLCTKWYLDCTTQRRSYCVGELFYSKEFRMQHAECSYNYSYMYTLLKN